MWINCGGNRINFDNVTSYGPVSPSKTLVSFTTGETSRSQIEVDTPVEAIDRLLGTKMGRSGAEPSSDDDDLPEIADTPDT